MPRLVLEREEWFADGCACDNVLVEMSAISPELITGLLLWANNGTYSVYTVMSCHIAALQLPVPGNCVSEMLPWSQDRLGLIHA